MIKNNNNNGYNKTDKYIGDIIKLYFKVTEDSGDAKSNKSNDVLTKNIKILKSFKFVKKVIEKKELWKQ